MVWCNDSYYVFGWSESHGKVAKFRVDRMHLPAAADMPFRVRPEDYDITAFCRRVFSMYDGKTQSVELKCGNSLMKAVIDRFGEEVSVPQHGRRVLYCLGRGIGQPHLLCLGFYLQRKNQDTVPADGQG